MTESHQPSQWAMLVQDAELRVNAKQSDGDGSKEVMLRHKVPAKRFWMLAGNWGEQRNLFLWINGVVNNTPGVDIKAKQTVSTISVREWAMIANDDMIPAGFKSLSEEDYQVWMTAIEKISHGKVAEGEAILRGAAFIY